MRAPTRTHRQLEHGPLLRSEEERNGLLRWLRPEFQNPSGKTVAAQPALLGAEVAEGEETAAGAAAWPKKLAEQVAAVRDLVARGASVGSAWSVGQVVAAFNVAAADDVEDVQESLAALGVVVAYEEKSEKRWRGVGRVAA